MARRDQLHVALDMLLDLAQKYVTHPVPPGVGSHFRAARREALLGVRAMVDAAIERLDEAPAAAAGPTSIKINAE
ncbi:MAG TPA: hypothetical protein VD969_00520 [Symbiobacteriaceae bacterium]|nr:hypothetical protein [Symbiobacteriaceae bacterium]